MIGRRFVILLFLINTCLLLPATAEEIKLKSGKVIEAIILETNDDRIRTQIPGGSLLYYLDEIESIDGKPVKTSSDKGTAPKKESADDGLEALPSDPKGLFRAKLIKLLVFAINGDMTSLEAAQMMESLLQFAKDHHDSVFAKDARFAVEYLQFKIWLYEKDEEKMLKTIKGIERIAYEYPFDSLEDYTCKIFLSVLPEEIVSGPFIYYPYYLRGYISEISDDYLNAIDKYTYIKDRLIPKKMGEAVFLQDVYLRLIKAYTISNRVPESRAITREAIKKFPDTPFARELQKDLPDDNIFNRPPRM